jgi:tetratricopeptide (TPR) repeat protein
LPSRVGEAFTFTCDAIAMVAVADLLAEAVRLHRAGSLVSAQTAYQAVLALAPGHAAALVNLANLLRVRGDPDAGIAACRQALCQAPNLPEAHITLGACQLSARRPEAALTAYRAAVALRPDCAVAQAGLGVTLLRLNQPAPALLAGEAACAADPRLAEAWFVRGSALARLGRPRDAVAMLQAAVTRDPSHAAAHLNLGNAWLDLDRFAEAEAQLRRAIALAPALAEAHASLGFLLTSTGRLAEAAAACDEAIRLRPEFAQAYWNRSFTELLAGDYARGWEDYEWRKRHDRFGKHFRRLAGPEWHGEALAGRRLLVFAEQGLGDTIQFARFLPLLRALGAHVMLACAPSLRTLLGQLPVEVVAKDTTLPPYDLWIDQMSLPRLLGADAHGIPAAGGYLAADPLRLAAWRGRLPPGPLVGLVWAGNPEHSNDARRSMPAASLAPLLACRRARFVSLQVGANPDVARRLGLIDCTAALTDFAETAALVSALDLVVAVDTSTAHLAGALGRPTWVVLPYAPDWRWMVGRDDSPWYASMRLFRQRRPGDWSELIGRVVAALAEGEGLCPLDPHQRLEPLEPMDGFQGPSPLAGPGQSPGLA